MMETDKFIKLVRERKFLYRKKNNNFISRRKVAETWLEIARLMGTGNGKRNKKLFPYTSIFNVWCDVVASIVTRPRVRRVYRRRRSTITIR